MKKINKMLWLFAILFLSVSVAACSDRKNAKGGDKDDEDTENVTDRYDDDDYVSSSHSVEDFCSTLSDISDRIAGASSANEVKNIADSFKGRMESFKNNTAQFTDADREKIRYALGYFFGVVYGKITVLSGSELDEAVLDQMTDEIDRVVDGSDNFQQLYRGLDNLM